MSATFKEDKLQFEFDSEWKVMKWDDHSAYRDGLHKFGDTKAVDFVALVWLNPKVIVTSRSLAQPAQIQGLTVTSLP